MPRPAFSPRGTLWDGGRQSGARLNRQRVKSSADYSSVHQNTQGRRGLVPARARPAGRGGGKTPGWSLNLIPPTGAVRFKHSRWPLCSSSCSATLQLFRCKATASPQPSHQHASPPSSRDPTSLTTHGLILMYKLLYVHCHSCDSTQPKLYTSWAATRRPWLS